MLRLPAWLWLWLCLPGCGCAVMMAATPFPTTPGHATSHATHATHHYSCPPPPRALRTPMQDETRSRSSDTSTLRSGNGLGGPSGTLARCVAGKAWTDFDIELLNRAGELRKWAVARLTQDPSSHGLHALRFELITSELLGLQLRGLPPPTPRHLLVGGPAAAPPVRTTPHSGAASKNKVAPATPRPPPGPPLPQTSAPAGGVIRPPEGIVQHWELRWGMGACAPLTPMPAHACAPLLVKVLLFTITVTPPTFAQPVCACSSLHLTTCCSARRPLAPLPDP